MSERHRMEAGMSAWGQIFGQDDSMNRAERRARDKEWARFNREQRRTRARSRKIEKKED